MLAKKLYNSEDELISDVVRLMMLQDQEGLKLRVLQLYRDREQTLLNAQAYVRQNRKNDRVQEAQDSII